MTGSNPRKPKASGTSPMQAARVKGRNLPKGPPLKPMREPLLGNVAKRKTRKPAYS